MHLYSYFEELSFCLKSVILSFIQWNTIIIEQKKRRSIILKNIIKNDNIVNGS